MEMNKAKGHLAMLGANVMWGLMSPVAKIVFAAGVVAPMVMVDFRVAGAAALFWLTSLFLPREHVPTKDILRLFGAGMLGVLFNQGCFILGVSLTSPGEASLVTTTMPMWVMLLAWLILREPITLKKAGGIAAGAAGAIILIAGNGARSGGANPALGDLIVLCAQLSYALYLTLYRNFIRKYSLVTLMKWMFLSAAVVGLPASAHWLAATDWGGDIASGMERHCICGDMRHVPGLYLHHDRSKKIKTHIGRNVQLCSAYSGHRHRHHPRT